MQRLWSVNEPPVCPGSDVRCYFKDPREDEGVGKQQKETSRLKEDEKGILQAILSKFYL